MRVFKTTYTDRQGKQREAVKWYIEFRDHAETVRRLPAFTDKAQSEQAGRNIEKMVAARINHEPLEGQLAKWFGGLPTKMQETLAVWGVVEGKAVVGRKTLDKHLEDFHGSLIARGNTAQHANLTRNRAQRLLAECGFRLWGDIDSAKIERQLAKLRDEGLSRQSSNYYLQSVRQFARWMVREERATSSPVEHLQPLNAAVDRGTRRALNVDELRRLLAATLNGPDRFEIKSHERALVYRLAVETGLRANELRSLTRASFQFGRKHSTVTVEAASSKRRRRDELPLRPDTAELIRGHVGTKLPTASVFDLPRKDNMADMIRRDLAAARKAWLAESSNADERAERERSTFLAVRDDAGGTFDFHSLRHTFLTNLARSGVHPKVAQQLARHSTVTLTLDRYTHADSENLIEAVGLLPNLCGPVAESLKATGTYDATSADSVLASCLAQMHSEPSISVQSGAVNSASGYESSDGPKSLIPQEFPAIHAGVSEMTPLGLEPRTYGLKDDALSA